MIRRATTAGLFILLALTMSRPQDVQVPDSALPANQVQQLATQGDWEAARKATEEILRGCESGPAGTVCRQVNKFTLGYLAQQEALDSKQQGEDRPGLLEEALKYYKAVLADSSADGPTLNNLAVVEQELGDVASAAAAWQNAVEMDPERSGQYTLRLGDLLFSQNRVEEARNQYKRSANFSPDAEPPRQRLVETYRHAPYAELQELVPALFQMEGLFPRVARSGYELLISRGYSEHSSDADQALIRWTIVMARQGWISADSLDALPTDWKSPSVTELRQYWASPASTPLPWHWWLSSDQLRHVIFDVSLMAGKQLVQDQQPEKAAACWNAALSMAKDLHGNGPAVPPGVPSIPSPLLIRGELYLLHFQYPKLKGAFHNFNEMLKDYAGAYNDQNLPDLQEYHTILGKIFAAQHRWVLISIPLPLPQLGLGITRWGAIAELGAALKVAEQRGQQEGFYQPLGEIKALLAKGYQTRKKLPEAQQMYLRAAIAYLDDDALPESTRMVENYRKAGGLGDEAAFLDQLIRYRIDLPSAKPTESSEPWLFKPSSLLDETFLLRQRFKAYADLADRASLSRPERLGYALDAYNLATKQDASLVGAADLLRWERITAKLLEVANLQPLPVRPLEGAELVANRERVTKFSFDGDLNPVGVAFSRETQTAAAIVTAVGATNALLLKQYVRVHNDEVFVRQQDLPPEVNSIIRDLQNAGSVHVNPMTESPTAGLEMRPRLEQVSGISQAQ